MMRKLTTITITLGLALIVASTAVAAARTPVRRYVPRPHARCRAHYHREHVRVVERRRVRRHGHRVWVRVRHHGRLVHVRRVECVRTHHRAAKPSPAPPTNPTPTPPGVVRASIDPSYTQDPSDNLKVTWLYSAGVTDGTLPAGTLSLTVTQPNQAGYSGGCTMNVGAGTYEGYCTVELPSYGAWNITVTYSGSSSTVAPTTSTETETIEPLPATVNETWGTDAPTASPQASATVIGSQAAVVVTDPNFEGASSVQVLDQWGDACTATVSGKTAACTMTVTATPTRFTVDYPGGTSTQSVKPVSPGGEQAVTYQWPATTAQIPNPQVTVQQATVAWNGGSALPWAANSGNPPNPLPVSVGESASLGAVTTGSLSTDQVPAGYVTYTIAGGPSSDWTDVNEYYSIAPSGSQDCSQVSNVMGEANALCRIVFSQPGSYTVTLSYGSQDPNYADEQGPSVTVDVS